MINERYKIKIYFEIIWALTVYSTMLVFTVI